jgi:hypothetical protein
VKDPSGQATTLMIRTGKIINSTALERQRRLGELLIHRGILKRSVLAQLLALQRTVDSDKRLGQILVERDIVTEATIREVLRLQLEEEIWNLFGLEEGEFHFEQTDDDKLGEASVSIDIEPLLLEGTRRQDEWRKILKVLPSDKLILSVTDIRKLAPANNRIRFSPSEWRVLAQINGRNTIRGIINRSGMGRFEVYRILSEFLSRKITYVRPGPTPQRNGSDDHGSVSSSAVAAPRKMGGLFTRLAGGGRRDERGGNYDFVSPVGSMTYFINRVNEQVYALKEMRNPEDANLVEVTWTDLIVNFTKADLVYAEGQRLNADRLEAYLKMFDFNESIQDCYEDTIEALLQLVDALYRLYAARVGDRVIARIVKETLDEMASRTTHHYAGDFKLEERIQGVLKLAAA